MCICSFCFNSQQQTSPVISAEKEVKLDSNKKKRLSHKGDVEMTSKQKKLDPAQRTLCFKSLCKQSTLKVITTNVKVNPKEVKTEVSKTKKTPKKNVKLSANHKEKGTSALGTMSGSLSFFNGKKLQVTPKKCVVSLDILSHSKVMSATNSPAKAKLLQLTPQKKCTTVGISPRKTAVSLEKSLRVRLQQTPPKKGSSSSSSESNKEVVISKETSCKNAKGKDLNKTKELKRKLINSKSQEKSAKGKKSKCDSSPGTDQGSDPTLVKKIKASKSQLYGAGKEGVDLTTEAKDLKEKEKSSENAQVGCVRNLKIQFKKRFLYASLCCLHLFSTICNQRSNANFEF